jgi:hypothetical protein
LAAFHAQADIPYTFNGLNASTAVSGGFEYNPATQNIYDVTFNSSNLEIPINVSGQSYYQSNPTSGGALDFSGISSPNANEVIDQNVSLNFTGNLASGGPLNVEYGSSYISIQIQRQNFGPPNTYVDYPITGEIVNTAPIPGAGILFAAGLLFFGSARRVFYFSGRHP